MSNPYESPPFAEPVIHAELGDREKARRVARYQRWVLYALLANIVLNIVMIATPADPVILLPLYLIALVIVAITMFSVFKLAKELYNTVIAVIGAILMPVPCISLLTLLVINNKATTFLQRAGIKVGFMGANPTTI